MTQSKPRTKKLHIEEETGTKDRIIYEALRLFSVNGYEAVSTRMIARAINASDTVIYKHFKNKQEILDTIVIECQKRFAKQQLAVDICHTDWYNLEEVCMNMYQFQITDEWIVMFRRLVVIEQFRDPRMAELYKSFFIDIALDGVTHTFAQLMEQGYLKQNNPRVLATELYAPFFMYHTLQERSPIVLHELREHVVCFVKNYSTEKLDKERERKNGLHNN